MRGDSRRAVTAWQHLRGRLSSFSGYSAAIIPTARPSTATPFSAAIRPLRARSMMLGGRSVRGPFSLSRARRRPILGDRSVRHACRRTSGKSRGGRGCLRLRKGNMRYLRWFKANGASDPRSERFNHYAWEAFPGPYPTESKNSCTRSMRPEFCSL